MINCATNSRSPFWAVNLADDGVMADLQFTNRGEQLNQNGLFQVETPEMPATDLRLLINDTEKNNQTSIKCVGDSGSESFYTTLFVYGKSLGINHCCMHTEMLLVYSIH